MSPEGQKASGTAYRAHRKMLMHVFVLVRDRRLDSEKGFYISTYVVIEIDHKERVRLHPPRTRLPFYSAHLRSSYDGFHSIPIHPECTSDCRWPLPLGVQSQHLIS